MVIGYLLLVNCKLEGGLSCLAFSKNLCQYGFTKTK